MEFQRFEQNKVFLMLNVFYAGSALLVLCSTDMSENSYYGDTMLHHLNQKGDSSNIQLSTLNLICSEKNKTKKIFSFSGKNGPIYSMEWSPIADEFCVVYGCMFWS